MLPDSALFLHIAGGSVAIVAGYAALGVRKGARPHRVAGDVFVVAMLVMALFALLVAITKGQVGNVLAATFAGYLVLSGYQAVRRPPGQVGRLEVAGCTFAGAMAVAAVLAGLTTQRSPGTPAFASYVFAVVAMLAAALDLRMLRRGGLVGFERLRRHLWRMCTALFVATGSFFLGQMDEMPLAVRGPHLFVLALAPLAALLFWMVRTRRRKRFALAPAVT